MSKKTIIGIILIICIISFAFSLQGERFTFGGVTLKDTLSGSVKIISGGIYLDGTDSINIAGMVLNSSSLRDVTGGVHFVDNITYIDDDGDDLRYTTGSNGTHIFNDDVKTDSSYIVKERTGATSTLTDGAEMRIYMKGDNFVISYNDAGTMRYYYFDLTTAGDISDLAHAEVEP